MEVPKVQNCIVCEDLRPELNRKSSILGFFGILPNATILIDAVGNVIQRLCLMFIIEAFNGELTLSFRLSDPNGTQVVGLDEKTITVSQDQIAERLNLGLSFFNVKFETLGVYKVELLFKGETIFSSTFRVGLKGKNSPSTVSEVANTSA